MSDSTRAIRSFPPLLPPARPKKTPSPRLSQRRISCRGTTSSNSWNDPEMDPENNENRINQRLAFSQSQSSKVLTAKNQREEEPSPEGFLHTSPDIVVTRRPLDEAPLSPMNTLKEPLALNQADQELVLTPRLEDSQDDSQVTLTPPVRSPTPLIVSVKRLGSKVKRTSSSKRRRPIGDDNLASGSDDDDANEMKLPEGLSPAQRTQEYWKRCYGSQQPPQHPSWSAQRAAPAKSCLSHSKPRHRPQTQILLPPASAFLSPSSGSINQSSPPLYSTPKSSPNDVLSPQVQHKCSHFKSVQFGSTEAAEYDLDAPSARFTPLPAEYARERFPLTKKQEEIEAEEEEIEETKENSAVLAEWETDFDSFVGDDEENDRGDSSKGRKRHNSRRHRSSQKKHRRGHRSERRRSCSFSAPNVSKPLLVQGGTPEKQNIVMNDLASLSMNSPSPDNCLAEHLVGGNTENCNWASPSLSPVVARRLSAEPSLQVITQEDKELPAASGDFKPETLASTVNIWKESLNDGSLLSTEWNFDPVTTYFNLAMKPCNLQNESPRNHPESQPGFDDIIASMHSSTTNLVQTCMSACFDPDAISSHNDDYFVPASKELRSDWNKASLHKWKQREAKLCQRLANEMHGLKEQIDLKLCSLRAVDMPAAASIDPTQHDLSGCEDAIRKLETMIREERNRKYHYEQRLLAAKTKTLCRHAPFAMLSFHAIHHVSPLEFVFTSKESQAIHKHLTTGRETRLDIHTFDMSHVSVPSSTDYKVGTVSSNEILKFYEGMLCQGESSNIVNDELFAIINHDCDDLHERLMQFSVILGRIDLAAQGLQRLKTEHDVSVNIESENESSVVAAKIALPNATVIAQYRRNTEKSLFWSLPTDFSIDAKELPALDMKNKSLGHMSQKSRSLAATAGLLRLACNMVLNGNAHGMETSEM